MVAAVSTAPQHLLRLSCRCLDDNRACRVLRLSAAMAALLRSRPAAPHRGCPGKPSLSAARACTPRAGRPRCARGKLALMAACLRARRRRREPPPRSWESSPQTCQGAAPLRRARRVQQAALGTSYREGVDHLPLSYVRGGRWRRQRIEHPRRRGPQINLRCFYHAPKVRAPRQRRMRMRCPRGLASPQAMAPAATASRA